LLTKPSEVTANRSKTGGYTKAVDLWSLGCVAVILLTGASAFTDPTTQQYSALLAKQCNLQSLQQSRDWKTVRQRPRNFVERLLVLAEDQRMTAAEALEHDWFSNDFHKTNFEELYKRAIKHWRPRPSRCDVFEFSDASSARRLARTHGIIRDKSPTGPRPSPLVDSHYRPFYRQKAISVLHLARNQSRY
jgi:serine/threonine protein kinase